MTATRGYSEPISPELVLIDPALRAQLLDSSRPTLQAGTPIQHSLRVLPHRAADPPQEQTEESIAGPASRHRRLKRKWLALAGATAVATLSATVAVPLSQWQDHTRNRAAQTARVSVVTATPMTPRSVPPEAPPAIDRRRPDRDSHSSTRNPFAPVTAP